MKTSYIIIKLIALTASLVLVQFAGSTQAADKDSFTEYILGVKIEVCDEAGFPVQDAKVGMKYSKSSSVDEKRTKEDGATYLPLYYSTSEVQTAPLYELTVEKPGYNSFIYRADKPAKSLKPIQLKEDLGWKVILKKTKLGRPVRKSR